MRTEAGEVERHGESGRERVGEGQRAGKGSGEIDAAVRGLPCTFELIARKIS